MQTAQPLEKGILSFLEGKVPSIQTAGTCSDAALGSSDSPAQAVQKLKSSSAPGPKVLLVCGSADADLASEAASVSQYSQALTAAFEKHTVAYISVAQRQVTQHPSVFAESSLTREVQFPEGQHNSCQNTVYIDNVGQNLP